ncbi:TetR/AcrR family transcriptional regulator [Streptomyces sp. NRRL F-5126]|uniref:TetR/AcrR family transcriptional regulator n=1 Tax=Streptomyces sp. NRRL F-5126 TaxID=1463857 RepID=UPI0004C9FE34|nr:TetR/AcrR family transcriptional regulator [Streptomyces sp. NRRL F-5126]
MARRDSVKVSGKPLPLQARKRQRTRDSILSAAWLLFTRDGVSDTSIRNIAELAEVSEMTVYNHFNSRGELIEAAVAMSQPDVATTVEAIEELHADGGPFEILEQMADRIRGATSAELKVRRKYRELARSEPELMAAYLTRREHAADALTEALLPRAAGVGMTEQDLRLLCVAFSALSETVAATQTADTTPGDWADDLVHALNLLRAGWGGAR